MGAEGRGKAYDLHSVSDEVNDVSEGFTEIAVEEWYVGFVDEEFRNAIGDDELPEQSRDSVRWAFD